jgi:hypothetical protein
MKTTVSEKEGEFRLETDVQRERRRDTSQRFSQDGESPSKNHGR